MGIHTLPLVCLLAVGGSPSDVAPINDRSFNIPINITEPARRAEIGELHLLVSTDQGHSWNKVAVAPPDQSSFPYQAPSDGSYWFKIAVIDHKGNQDPPNPLEGPPDLKVLVDTIQPQLTITAAERQGEEVVVRWEIVDQAIDLATLRLQYRTADAPGWNPVHLTPALAGQVAFRPATPGAVLLRMDVQDLAKNVGSAQAEVPAAPAATVGYAPSAPPPWSPIQGAQPAVLREPPREQRNSPTSGGSGWNTPGGAHVVASSSGVPAPAFTNQVAPAAPLRGLTPPAPGPTIPLKVVNGSRINLDYEVAKFGPSGVGSVELYVTRDEGKNWQSIGGEKDIPAPTANELSGPAATMRRSLTVELPEEGVYGFYLVVRNGAGLGKPPPRPGELPQMRVEVDRTPPEAALYAPEPAPGRRDALILRWVVKDKNLTAAPITLQWAAQPGGPWQPIGGPELPNNGSHVWQVPPGVPPRVFLRLTVRDTAGNTGVAETPEPILIDLTEPEARILGVGPP